MPIVSNEARPRLGWEFGDGRAGWRQLVSDVVGAGLLLGAALILAAALGANGASAATSSCSTGADTCSVTYEHTGGDQTFAVPAGVTSITVKATGGPGYSTGFGSF